MALVLILASLHLMLPAGCASSDAIGTCATDDDCLVLDDGDRCNGTMRCALGTCVADPTPVTCKAVACRKVACVPATGACDGELLPDGTHCDDRDPCTMAESCAAGACGGGTASCQDEGNPCTTEMCISTTGECQHVPVATLGACDDGNQCTDGDVCVGGTCSGTEKVCVEDENPCTTMSCRLETGKCEAASSPDGTACEDGDVCTGSDTCQGGTCSGGPSPCPSGPCETATCDATTGFCQFQPLADGTLCDDQDKCTSGDLCQGGACVGGDSPCPPSTNPCLLAFCNPSTGACLAKPGPNGLPCDDEDACTFGDACLVGSCVGTPVDCPTDGESCTTEACEPATGACVTTVLTDGASCEDGSKCTAPDQCTAGKCTALGPKCPDDGNSCTKETCNAASGDCGVILVTDGGACEDGNPCTSNDTCLDLVCHAGKPVTCAPDADPCTVEACVPGQGGCVILPSPEGSACDDGDVCNVGETCQSGQCTGGEPADCQKDAGPCEVAFCSPAVGCKTSPRPDGVSCTDGDACTGGDACKAGACVAKPIVCPGPSTPCVTVSCDVAKGCIEVPIPDGKPCDDGSLCTPETTCKGGKCTGKGKQCPPPGDPCLVAVCSPATAACGLAPAPNGAACDDGDPCTVLDACLDTACLGGGPAPCPAGTDVCSPLVCDPKLGACAPSKLKNGTPCAEGSKCTTSGTCSGGKCNAVPIVTCPPAGAPCAVVTCDPATGKCLPGVAPDGAECDDDEPCTTATTCLGATCQGGEPAACPDDGNPCTAESCAPGEGCHAVAANDGAACDDADPCTVATTCTSGACLGGSAATCKSDGDPCTNDACVPLLGCTYPLGANGVPCDDGSACTSGDECQSGECVGLVPKACQKPEGACQVAICDATTGACGTAPAPDGAPCSDGNVCTTTDHCLSGACLGAPVLCPQGDDPCTVTVCDPGAAACIDVPATLGSACDDGLLCTIDDACDGQGLCEGGALPCPASTTACQEATCNAATGACQIVVSDNGSPCDDGDPCEGGDFCLQGTCAGGGSPACEASGACRDVACDAETGACSETVSPNGVPCDDGAACTFGEVCSAGACTGGKPIVCPETPDPCTSSACDPGTGICGTIPAAPGASCEDGDPCTVGDVCVQGGCAGLPNACPEPSGVCRQVACNSVTEACEETPIANGKPCDDAQECTSSDACFDGKCYGKPVVCSDTGTDCLTSTCVPGTGCVTSVANDGKPCDDSACFVTTTCLGGTCLGGQPLACPDPGVACRVAICTEATGCTSQPGPNGVTCNDGNPCTAGDQCVGGKCLGAAVACPDPGPCGAPMCDPAKGCVAVPDPDGGACNDGNPCTQVDSCHAGTCQGAQPKACTGGSTCEPEACSPATGLCAVTTAPPGTPCDDGNPCTTATTCDSGACLGGAPVACPTPKDPCHGAVCVPKTGACEEVALADGTACDDGSLCTSKDACYGAVCVGRPTVTCPGPVGCLFSACDPKTGACGPALGAEGAACDDGDPCNLSETCEAGNCGGGAPGTVCCATADECDDGTPCTVDLCTEGRCGHTLADLPACIGRIVVAGQGDSELTILDARTLAVAAGSPVVVPGLVRALASAPRASLVYAAIPNHAGSVIAFDPFQPDAPVPAPSSATPATMVAVDDALGLVVVLRETGAAAVYHTRTGALVADGLLLPPGPGFPALDAETHRLYVPSSSGWVGVLDLAGVPTVLPGTPFPVGGGPVAAGLDTNERLLLADPLAKAVRVLTASAAAALPGDPRTGFGTPTGLDVDPGTGRLFVAYPAGDTVRAFDLADLDPSTPPGVGLIGSPQSVRVDVLTGRLLIVGAKAAKLHVLSAQTLSPAAGSPVTVAAGPVDAVVLWAHPGPIVITEAMIHPTAVSQDAGEWLELHNPGTTPVALDGWQLETDFDVHVIQSGGKLVVPAGGFALLCRNGNAAQNGGIACNYTYGLVFPLADSGVNVTIKTPAGVLIDHAALLGPVPSGKTLALRHPGYENGRRASWSVSVGTPGKANADVDDSK